MTAMNHHGCSNRPDLGTPQVVQDGWIESAGGISRMPRLRMIEFKNSTSCQYTHSEAGKTDPKCLGCQWAVGRVQRAAEVACS